jgi:hypothetical protein
LPAQFDEHNQIIEQLHHSHSSTRVNQYQPNSESFTDESHYMRDESPLVEQIGFQNFKNNNAETNSNDPNKQLNGKTNKRARKLQVSKKQTDGLTTKNPSFASNSYEISNANVSKVKPIAPLIVTAANAVAASMKSFKNQEHYMNMNQFIQQQYQQQQKQQQQQQQQQQQLQLREKPLLPKMDQKQGELAYASQYDLRKAIIIPANQLSFSNTQLLIPGDEKTPERADSLMDTQPLSTSSSSSNNSMESSYSYVHAATSTVESYVGMANVTKSTRRVKPLPELAVSIMKEWYEQHSGKPYPRDEERREMAIKGQISEAQVKAWFANKRNRVNKSLKQTQEASAKRDKDLINVSKTGIKNKGTTKAQTLRRENNNSIDLIDLVNGEDSAIVEDEQELIMISNEGELKTSKCVPRELVDQAIPKPSNNDDFMPDNSLLSSNNHNIFTSCTMTESANINLLSDEALIASKQKRKRFTIKQSKKNSNSESISYANENEASIDEVVADTNTNNALEVATYQQAISARVSSANSSSENAYIQKQQFSHQNHSEQMFSNSFSCVNTYEKGIGNESLAASNNKSIPRLNSTLADYSTCANNNSSTMSICAIGESLYNNNNNNNNNNSDNQSNNSNNNRPTIGLAYYDQAPAVDSSFAAHNSSDAYWSEMNSTYNPNLAYSQSRSGLLSAAAAAVAVVAAASSSAQAQHNQQQLKSSQNSNHNYSFLNDQQKLYNENYNHLNTLANQSLSNNSTGSSSFSNQYMLDTNSYENKQMQANNFKQYSHHHHHHHHHHNQQYRTFLDNNNNINPDCAHSDSSGYCYGNMAQAKHQKSNMRSFGTENYNLSQHVSSGSLDSTYRSENGCSNLREHNANMNAINSPSMNQIGPAHSFDSSLALFGFMTNENAVNNSSRTSNQASSLCMAHLNGCGYSVCNNEFCKFYCAENINMNSEQTLDSLSINKAFSGNLKYSNCGCETPSGPEQPPSSPITNKSNRRSSLHTPNQLNSSSSFLPPSAASSSYNATTSSPISLSPVVKVAQQKLDSSGLGNGNGNGVIYNSANPNSDLASEIVCDFDTVPMSTVSSIPESAPSMPPTNYVYRREYKQYSHLPDESNSHIQYQPQQHQNHHYHHYHQLQHQNYIMPTRSSNSLANPTPVYYLNSNESQPFVSNIRDKNVRLMNDNMRSISDSQYNQPSTVVQQQQYLNQNHTLNENPHDHFQQQQNNDLLSTSSFYDANNNEIQMNNSESAHGNLAQQRMGVYFSNKSAFQNYGTGATASAGLFRQPASSKQTNAIDQNTKFTNVKNRDWCMNLYPRLSNTLLSNSRANNATSNDDSVKQTIDNLFEQQHNPTGIYDERIEITGSYISGEKEHKAQRTHQHQLSDFDDSIMIVNNQINLNTSGDSLLAHHSNIDQQFILDNNQHSRI